MVSLEGRRHHQRRTSRTGTELHAFLVDVMFIKVIVCIASFLFLRGVVVVVWLLSSLLPPLCCSCWA
jgi:hypothetical protein